MKAPICFLEVSASELRHNTEPPKFLWHCYRRLVAQVPPSQQSDNLVIMTRTEFDKLNDEVNP